MSASTKFVYRVRQLPYKYKELDVRRLLKDVLRGINQLADVKVLSLAETTSTGDGPPSQVATVKFFKTPEELLTQDKEWELSEKDTRLDVVVLIDLRFLGFTSLYHPKVEHHYDCIAISGLGSHPFGSWKCRNSRSDFMWLRDHLPKQFPYARSLLYGFDSEVDFSESHQTVKEVAATLVTKLKNLYNHSNKPLIFLAHSLGGIILKNALVLIARGEQSGCSILSAIKAIFFFGVPHRGMSTSALSRVVAGKPNEMLVSQLEENGAYLKGLEDSFQRQVGLKHIRIVSAFETKATPTVKRKDGKLSRSGPAELLVTFESAKHPKSTKSEIFPIDANHSDIVKFSMGDSNLDDIMACFGKIMRDQAGGAAHPSTDIQLQAANPAGTKSIKDAVNAVLRKRKAPTRNLNTPPQSNEASSEQGGVTQARQELLDSLAFTEADTREENVYKARENTFGWIFEQKKFKSWLKKSKGVYWISGKPGSGKSTLMKFIMNHPKTKKALEKNSPNSSAVASFFFHGRGSLQQKSFQGLLRAILHKIITQVEFLQPLIWPVYYGLGKQTEDRKWTSTELKKCLDLILGQRDKDLTITLFLDALDEYDGTLQDIANFIKQLKQTQADSRTRVKLLFSSRPENHFLATFGEYPRVQIHEHTHNDIIAVIDETINEHLTLKQVVKDLSSLPNPRKVDIVNTIIKKANGVFLWVDLVLQQLCAATEDGAMAHEIPQILSNMPLELEDMYKTALENIPENKRFSAYVMIEITLRSPYPLSVPEFIYVADCANYEKVVDCISRASILDNPGLGDFDTYDRRLKSVCRGLLEVYGEGEDRKVQFLHETLREWAKRSVSPNQILIEKDSRFSENGYTFLGKAMLARIFFEGRKVSSTEQRFMDVCDLFHMAEKTTDISNSRIFDGISSDMFSNLHLEPRIPVFFDLGAYTGQFWLKSVWHFFVAANLKLFLRERLTPEALVSSRPEDSLLFFAIVALHIGLDPSNNGQVSKPGQDMIEFLLKKAGKLEANFLGYFLECLRCAVSTSAVLWGYGKSFPNPFSLVMFSFLEKLQDMNSKVRVPVSLNNDEDGESPLTPSRTRNTYPLHIAVSLYDWESALAMTKFILERDGNPHNVDDMNENCLDRCYNQAKHYLEHPYFEVDPKSLYEIIMLLTDRGVTPTPRSEQARRIVLNYLNAKSECTKLYHQNIIEREESNVRSSKRQKTMRSNVDSSLPGSSTSSHPHVRTNTGTKEHQNFNIEEPQREARRKSLRLEAKDTDLRTPSDQAKKSVTWVNTKKRKTW